MVIGILSIILPSLVALWGIYEKHRKNKSTEINIPHISKSFKFNILLVIVFIVVASTIFNIFNEVRSTNFQKSLTEDISEFKNKSQENQSKIQKMVQLSKSSNALDYNLASVKLNDYRCVAGRAALEISIDGGADFYVLVDDNGNVITEGLNNERKPDFITFAGIEKGVHNLLVFKNNKYGAFQLISYCDQEN